MFSKLKLALLALCICMLSYYPAIVNGQTIKPSLSYLVPSSGWQTISTCSGNLTDNGLAGNYLDNSDGTLTINPGTSGRKVQLTFSSFALNGYSDRLEIYNGASTSAPLIGYFCLAVNPVTTTWSLLVL